MKWRLYGDNAGARRQGVEQPAPAAKESIASAVPDQVAAVVGAGMSFISNMVRSTADDVTEAAKESVKILVSEQGASFGPLADSAVGKIDEVVAVALTGTGQIVGQTSAMAVASIGSVSDVAKGTIHFSGQALSQVLPSVQLQVPDAILSAAGAAREGAGFAKEVISGLSQMAKSAGSALGERVGEFAVATLPSGGESRFSLSGEALKDLAQTARAGATNVVQSISQEADSIREHVETSVTNVVESALGPDCAALAKDVLYVSKIAIDAVAGLDQVNEVSMSKTMKGVAQEAAHQALKTSLGGASASSSAQSPTPSLSPSSGRKEDKD